MTKGEASKRDREKLRKPQSRNETRLRELVIETALSMSRSGLSPCRSGNVSCRFEDGMLITPTGLAYEDLGAKDIVFVAGDGSVPGKQKKPSSEWHFHLSAYAARPDMNAVVHTHSLHAVVLACAGRAIPAFHYMVAVAGGDDIPVVPYATFGTPELAEHVARGLQDRKACLMAHHGAIALGETLPKALELAHEVEVLAEQYYKLLLLGPPELLSDSEMARVIEKFKSYGQNAQS
ncbi:L-fuculose-phosphate aldolase [Hyphomicrobium sp. DMF-1]|jgi:L-fuculose-phosphate aldolase|uniref:L-fuculose-phosphate aldolase n=1 Tax=Hyphomicrobium sp. DMF-1 TaxID=3019544 RepID=UPI0022EBF97B|nr:L-fuculose-phosphate aldolase [Hyphomicrobium sp. DMF-1]WBT38186.1 L-fuculose-phosphate aldolase [Hyphomicrobium sp. DMF-1]